MSIISSYGEFDATSQFSCGPSFPPEGFTGDDSSRIRYVMFLLPTNNKESKMITNKSHRKRHGLQKYMNK